MICKPIDINIKDILSILLVGTFALSTGCDGISSSASTKLLADDGGEKDFLRSSL